MVKIRFGPGGLGPVAGAVSNLEALSKIGLDACEIEFVQQVYIKDDEDIKQIKMASEKFGIKLSIHAPYYINLNSKENEKVEASKKRILKCCEIGDKLGARKIVFHCGFYSGMNSDEAFEKIKIQILELMQEIKKRKFDVELCPEVIGKKNVFGSIDEISRLVNETGCSFCVDFAHVLARYGKYEFELLKKSFPKKEWHCHFSGIEYGEKGEKNHKLTEVEDWKKVLDFLKKENKTATIICESPDPVEDSVIGKKIFGEV